VPNPVLAIVWFGIWELLGWVFFTTKNDENGSFRAYFCVDDPILDPFLSFLVVKKPTLKAPKYQTKLWQEPDWALRTEQISTASPKFFLVGFFHIYFFSFGGCFHFKIYLWITLKDHNNRDISLKDLS
jgi:hypothetical protein